LNKSLDRRRNGSQSFTHSGVLCPNGFFLSFFRWKSHAPLLGRRVRYSSGWPNCIGFDAILFETSVGSQNLRLIGFREETRVEHTLRSCKNKRARGPKGTTFPLNSVCRCFVALYQMLRYRPPPSLPETYQTQLRNELERASAPSPTPSQRCELWGNLYCLKN
jgi:hypothetical protein